MKDNGFNTQGIGGETYTVTFAFGMEWRTRREATMASVQFGRKGDTRISAVVRRNHKDTNDTGVAMKEALGKAVRLFDKGTRSLIWADFFKWCPEAKQGTQLIVTMSPFGTIVPSRAA